MGQSRKSSLNPQTLRTNRKKRLAALAAKSRRVTAEDLEEDFDLEDDEGDEELEGMDLGDLDEGLDEGLGEDLDEGLGEGEDEDLENLGLDDEGDLEDLGLEETLEGEDEGLEDDLEDDEDMEGMEDEDLPVANASARRGRRTRGSGEAKSAFNYNPIYQKPTHLGTYGPSSGYHYFGPPPDAGFSYGMYADADTDFGIISPLRRNEDNKCKAAYSPVTGKRMKLLGKADNDAVASVLAGLTSLFPMPADEGKACMTSANLGKHGMKAGLYSVTTGKSISKAMQKLIADMAPDNIPPAPGGSSGVPSPPTGTPTEEQAEEDEDDLDLELEDDIDEQAEGGNCPECGKEDCVCPAADDDAEAVRYEALQSVQAFTELAQADVHMTLFDDAEQNPYWNIDVRGMPVARVYLADQVKPEEIRSTFIGAEYYDGVSGAIEKVGLGPVLAQINAKAWANVLEQSTMAKTIRNEVEASADARVRATTENLMEQFLSCVAVVCAGMDKNFFREEGNPLKEALWAEVHSMGIANPNPIIEAGFRSGATAYFRTVTAKAIEFMEMHPEALAQVKQAIGESDVLTPGDETVGDELPDALPTDLDPSAAPTLAARLTMSSNAVAGVQTALGDAYGTHKEGLHSELSLGGAGPTGRSSGPRR